MALKTIHLDKEKNLTLIACLQDRHLINIIRYYCKQIIFITKALKNNDFNSDYFCDIVTYKVDPTNCKNFIVDEKSITGIIERIKELQEELASYVLEATVRGLTPYIVLNIQKAYNRTNELESLAQSNSFEKYTLKESVENIKTEKWLENLDKLYLSNKSKDLLMLEKELNKCLQNDEKF